MDRSALPSQLAREEASFRERALVGLFLLGAERLLSLDLPVITISLADSMHSPASGISVGQTALLQ